MMNDVSHFSFCHKPRKAWQEFKIAFTQTIWCSHEHVLHAKTPTHVTIINMVVLSCRSICGQFFMSTVFFYFLLFWAKTENSWHVYSRSQREDLLNQDVTWQTLNLAPPTWNFYNPLSLQRNLLFPQVTVKTKIPSSYHRWCDTNAHIIFSPVVFIKFLPEKAIIYSPCLYHLW